MTPERPAVDLASAFKNACLAELEALKPGNVHIFSDGHGMVVQDFIKSAEASSSVIALPNLSIGQRILNAVEATWRAVNCNTNLGIILLGAPLIHAALYEGDGDFSHRLKTVLNALNQEDAKLTYQAIAMAKPAGLGHVAQHDVHMLPNITLLEAMKSAANRDLIATQYATNYQLLFEFGLPRYAFALSQWQRPAWATTALYLGYLANWPDSHIQRKYGDTVALQVQQEAQAYETTFLALENSKNYLPQLLKFDESLKARKLNPGTSADLTVATLLLHELTQK